MQFPSGKFGFVGTVPEELYYADNAIPEKIRRVFDTKESAVSFADSKGFKVQA